MGITEFLAEQKRLAEAATGGRLHRARALCEAYMEGKLR